LPSFFPSGGGGGVVGGIGGGGGGGCSGPIAPSLSVYTDSDFGGCPDTARSTSGLIVFLAGCPVAWRSKRQDQVATSTCNAELVASYHGVLKLLHFRQLFADFGFQLPAPSPVLLDNQNSIRVAASPFSNKRVRHEAVRSEFVRENIAAGTIALQFVPGRHQLADLLTKALPGPRTVELRRSILGE
jgi:hypothetical protein